MNEQIYLGV